MKVDRDHREQRREQRRPLSQRTTAHDRQDHREAAFTEREREMAERTRRSARM